MAQHEALLIKDVSSKERKAELLEQYKIVVSSLDNTNETRESFNTFWTSAHSIILTALAFFMNSAPLNEQQKNLVLLTISLIGFFLCLSWIQAIGTIAQSIRLRNAILVQLEEYFPANIFSVQILSNKGTHSPEKLSLKEIQVPIFFLIGYSILSAFTLYGIYK